MGWKLIGMSFNSDFSKDTETVLKLLELPNYELVRESNFADETSSFLDDSVLSIGFFGTGTFVSTGNVNLITNDRLLSKVSVGIQVVAFYVSDITNTYCFDYYEDCDYKRRKWVSYSDEGIDSSENFGELPEEHAQADDDFELIVKIMSSVLGIDFYRIEEDSPMLKYVMLPIEENQNKELPSKKGFWRNLFR